MMKAEISRAEITPNQSRKVLSWSALENGDYSKWSYVVFYVYFLAGPIAVLPAAAGLPSAPAVASFFYTVESLGA